MGTKHTQGPWSCDRISEYTGEMLIVSPDMDTVARIPCLGARSGKPFCQEANARLISAAPDLLAALIATHDRLALNNESGAYSDLVWQARAAIASATGEAA